MKEKKTINEKNYLLLIVLFPSFNKNHLLNRMPSFSLLSNVTLIALFFNGFSVAYLVTAAKFFAVSLGSLILQEKYTTLLLKLQPDGTEYTFYT